MANFPDNFCWGAATSAYQIEGAANEDGRGMSIWDTFSRAPGNTANGDTGDVASDHYHLWESDIAIMQEIGIKHYRMSLSWPRLFPNGDDIREERGFTFYDNLINGLIEAGIQPLITLYHWDLPQALQDKGGWESRETVAAFGRYAAAVAEHFGDRVKSFSPINEPWCVSWLGYGIGVMAPGFKDRARAFKVAHHTVIAHGVALKAMRAVRDDLKLGPVINQSNFNPDDLDNPELVHAADVMDAQSNRWWTDAYFHGKYPEVLVEKFGSEITSVVLPGDMELAQEKNDFVGLNFYNDQRIGVADPSATGWYDISALFGLKINTEHEGELTDMGWPITPDGLRRLLVRWSDELGDRCPDFYVTENGCAYPEEPDLDGRVHDNRRISYLNLHIKAVSEAIAQGAPVKGYYQWSLLDNFEWALGYEKRFGMVHVDYRTQERTLKDSAHWYSQVIAQNGANIG